jgi:hypothetical protein
MRATVTATDREAREEHMRLLRKHLIVGGMILALSAGGAGVAVAGGDDDGDGRWRSHGDRSSLPQGSEPVCLNPADFTTQIDNPYWPMAPGSKWVYRETEADRELLIEVTVTDETRNIAGITAVVVHDVVTEGGELVEDTYDWYAQDSAGNVWYLGEDTKEYENGEVVSTAGSWEHGVDGAMAGIIMPAKPRVGLSYRQEYYAGEAEDAARVLSLDEKVQVPFGTFDNVLMTKDFTPLEPDLVEHKFYARGVGPVLTLGISGGSARTELVSYEPGPGVAARDGDAGEFAGDHDGRRSARALWRCRDSADHDD